MCVVLECAFIFSRVCCSLFLLLLAINYLNLIYNKHVTKIFNGKISNQRVMVLHHNFTSTNVRTSQLALENVTLEIKVIVTRLAIK
jgi:hypothetical protein